MQVPQQLDDISDRLGSLHLDPNECLPFNPTGDDEWLQMTFSDVPRYLFRVYTPKSRGTTDRIWAKSMDATEGIGNPQLDIFARDKHEVAEMLNRHLRWWPGDDDNLVSWTSSLLFALVYMFHLHANLSDGSPLDEIYLCVTDTTMFPPGVFLRDMDLIQAFSAFDKPCGKNLYAFQHLRSADYYFGEYISQGALKIQDKCQMVSTQAMIDKGLYNLQPKFSKFAIWKKAEKPPWAKTVLNLRKEFHQGMAKLKGISTEEQQAVMEIARLFGGRWIPPVAANVMALRPRQSLDRRITAAFRTFTDRERSDLSPKRTKVVGSDSMPEVNLYADILDQVYQDLFLDTITDHTRKAEAQLQAASLALDDNQGWIPRDNTLIAMIPQHAALQQQLHEILRLAGSLSEDLKELRAGMWQQTTEE